MVYYSNMISALTDVVCVSFTVFSFPQEILLHVAQIRTIYSYYAMDSMGLPTHVTLLPSYKL